MRACVRACVRNGVRACCVVGEDWICVRRSCQRTELVVFGEMCALTLHINEEYLYFLFLQSQEGIEGHPTPVCAQDGPQVGLHWCPTGTGITSISTEELARAR